MDEGLEFRGMGVESNLNSEEGVWNTGHHTISLQENAQIETLIFRVRHSVCRLNSW